MNADLSRSRTEALRMAKATMEAQGLLLPELPWEQATLIRCQTAEDDSTQPHKRSGWFYVASFSVSNSREYVAGCFGNHKRGNQLCTLPIDWREIPEIAHETLRAQTARARSVGEAEILERGREAHDRSEVIFEKLPRAGKSDWLSNEGVSGFGLGYARGRVAIPLRSIKGAMRGLEFFDDTGKRSIITGTRTHGAAHFLGELEAEYPIILAASYPSAAAIHMATGWQTAYCVTLGNIAPVLQGARKRWPEREFGVAIDAHTGVDEPAEWRAAHKAASYGAFVVPLPS